MTYLSLVSLKHPLRRTEIRHLTTYKELVNLKYGSYDMVL